VPEERYAYSKRLLEIEEDLTPTEYDLWDGYRRSNEFRSQARKEAEQAGSGLPVTETSLGA
jgi:hypothetical protein